MMDCLLETPRLLLRPFAEADAPLVGQYSREPAARAELADEVCETDADARKLIAFLSECWQKQVYPLVLGVARRTDGLLVGHVGLSEIAEGIEIGYAIAQAHQRQGYAAEAAERMTRWAFERLGLPRVYGEVKQGNDGSGRVLLRAGYRYLSTTETEAFGGRFRVGHYVCEPEDLTR